LRPGGPTSERIERWLRARHGPAPSAEHRSPQLQAPTQCLGRCRGSRRSRARLCYEGPTSSAIDCGLSIRRQPAPVELDGEKHRNDSRGRKSENYIGLPVMLRPVGAGLAPRLDQFGLVFIRRRIGTSQRQAGAGLNRDGVRSVLETRTRHAARCIRRR